MPKKSGNSNSAKRGGHKKKPPKSTTSANDLSLEEVLLSGHDPQEPVPPQGPGYPDLLADDDATPTQDDAQQQPVDNPVGPAKTEPEKPIIEETANAVAAVTLECLSRAKAIMNAGKSDAAEKIDASMRSEHMDTGHPSDSDVQEIPRPRHSTPKPVTPEELLDSIEETKVLSFRVFRSIMHPLHAFPVL